MIGTVAYSDDERTYGFIDSLLVQAIGAAHLNKGTLEKLTYRVRRSATQSWGWNGNTGAATARCVVDRMHLLRIGTYNAQWEDEKAYTARVSWDYIDEYNAVWDERAQLMLRVILANREGAVVDTTEYVLTRTDREAKYKIVSLERPCIYYKVEMYLCSFYEDSTLMAQATGVREMIPANGTIKTNFYGEDIVIEKGYDLRAVLYCRNGNSFITSASKVLSGVKDTRRPQLFGTPEPVDGILSIGKNIVFNFSEDIEYNYLNQKTNFEVKGEVNNSSVLEAVSLLFTGEASVESEVRRNFSDKDLTIEMMIRPENTGKDMPLFSHGQNGNKLQLWLKADKKLMAVVGEKTYTSDKPVADGGFQQVAMVLTQPVGEDIPYMVTFYNGGQQIGQQAMTEGYAGNGPLIFGRTNETNRHKSQYYQGRMMEARVWYRALSAGLLATTYGGKRLTGRESGLVDYYPMNEGSGNYALDHTQGANAELLGATWAMPSGYSLHVDKDDHGLPLNQNALNRTNEQDYTLMFWFRTDSEGRGVLLSNGAGQKTDIGAKNQFCLGFEAEKLVYRSNGMAVEVPGDWSDNMWHHYAMTVSRTSGLANIYVDCDLRSSFPADSLGGISGGYPLIGAARFDNMTDGQVVTTDTRNWLRGNIDELCLFEQALPLSLITSYSTKSPYGDEAGLLTYLAFDRQERQKDNDIVLTPYAYSKKIYLNDEIDIDSRDIVGVFDRENQCHGLAHIDYSPLTGLSSLYLTVYDNQTKGRQLYFKLWQYTTGRELMLTPSVPVTFQNSTVLGVDEPVVFTGGDQYVQTFSLSPGWNWVSFNVASESLFNLNNLLDNLPWQEGDVLTDLSSDLTLIYDNGHWLMSGESVSVRLSPRKAYAIKVKQYVDFPVAGYIISQADQRTISLKQGWNGIGYTPMLNLSVETALADYYDKASVGDVVKSHSEFAYFSKVGGVGRWQGSLQYMKPGEGYMLMRKDSVKTSFTYPFFAPNSTFIDEWAYETTVQQAPMYEPQRHTMSIMAVVSGIDLQPGDRLLAYADGQQCGSAEIAAQTEGELSGEALSYLSIDGNTPKPVWFAIERDGEIVATTAEIMTFRATDVVGTPDTPASITFARQEQGDDSWYNVNGVQLPKKPTRKGVYLYNGKKVVIK